MTKSRAYIDEFGAEKISAWAVRQERNRYGGVPLGKTYWSLHRAGQRKPMKQVQKGNTSFFSYKNGSDGSGGGGGESLTHLLFKEAIASLTGTKLKLGRFGEHEITITHGETEKEIPHSKGLYYSDVYWRFSSSSALALKWSGEMYVEVHHTHAVPAAKQESLRQAGVAVVEVDVPQTLEYRHNEEITTDPLEAAHVIRIRNMLMKGFLAGRVVSDRSSVEYLEQQAADAARQEQELKRRTNAALNRVNIASEQKAVVKQMSDGLSGRVMEAATDVNEPSAVLSGDRSIGFDLPPFNSNSEEAVGDQEEAVRWRRFLLVCLGVSLVATLCFFVAY